MLLLLLLLLFLLLLPLQLSTLLLLLLLDIITIIEYGVAIYGPFINNNMQMNAAIILQNEVIAILCI